MKSLRKEVESPANLRKRSQEKSVMFSAVKAPKSFFHKRVGVQVNNNIWVVQRCFSPYLPHILAREILEKGGINLQVCQKKALEDKSETRVNFDFFVTSMITLGPIELIHRAGKGRYSLKIFNLRY